MNTLPKIDRPILTPEFYDRPTPKVALDLLGKFLVRRLPGDSEIALPINDVEVYDGFHDKASHARRGITRRNEVMYGGPGYFYVYYCYGIHWLLNIVTREAGYPAAVLIRGAGEYAGPARLTKAMSIDGSINRHPCFTGSELWVEDRGLAPPRRRVRRMPRIGVDYAGPVWAAKPWRFIWESEDGRMMR